jgi:hypothetical protein
MFRIPTKPDADIGVLTNTFNQIMQRSVAEYNAGIPQDLQVAVGDGRWFPGIGVIACPFEGETAEAIGNASKFSVACFNSYLEQPVKTGTLESVPPNQAPPSVPPLSRDRH